MREGKVVGSHVGDALDGILILDVGLGVRRAVGSGVSRIVGAVGFGSCEGSPSLPLSTIGVADTVKTTKSLRLPTI